MKKLTLNRLFPQWRAFDGEGDGEGEGEGEGKGGDEKKFTQAEVDGIINKRFAKEKKAQEASKGEKQKLISELNTLKQNSSLTSEERDTLSGRVEELENSLLSKEEVSAKEKKRMADKHAGELKAAVEDSKTWQSRFQDSTVDRALSDAAVVTEAVDASQIRMMFRGTTRLSEEKDEAGKGTGSFTPMLTFQGLGEDGKTLASLDMPVDKALEKIKTDGLHANLFRHKGRAGTGTPPTGGTGGGTHDPSVMPTPDQFKTAEEFSAAYQKYRGTYNTDGTKRDGVK